ncbi:L-glutamate gamma-semialdehyde dehydrogenase [Pseudalkalibacillus decolorationis]|uniref:L-glutamate gamma-semialdehyde dehydrogenase n=1 Tax=Pseudalkalibacillus decolorationis TaxID=163879 RepID=UPI0021489410|nr:L-glutamate gamma-semialdehyde dehydrogenase [Pseudalkalibacillus decolorationis]
MAIHPFKNEKSDDWEKGERNAELQQALASIREQFSTNYPLYINGEEIYTEKTVPSYNPSNHEQVLGYVSQARKHDVGKAIDAAEKAFEDWRLRSFKDRAMYLLKAAEIMRRRKAELVAWQIYEVGKNYYEADGEILEAIDFLEMYARKAIALGEEQCVNTSPGIENRLEYLPLGIGVIIPPWNFPLAILTGMTASAIVTGNTVLIKPSIVTPITGYKFMEIMQELHLPDGVVNFVPGSSREIGDFMVGHKDVNFISFTGSKEVGLHIDEIAHQRTKGQRWIKRVVSEMGGKNGVVVDETADLDAAAEAIVTSAFRFQGQKCSAGSRAIIHEEVYGALIEKIVERTATLKVGNTLENPDLGPVIDEKAYNNIVNYIELGKKEASLALGGSSDNGVGYYIEPTIFKDVAPESRIMREEIFGPVLAICKVSNFEEGIRVYNDTEYGLTGALFTKDRERMAYARMHMRCGNLFFNSKCTGAIVGVQPFGGYYMSGTGAKTGTGEYLLNFVQAKTTSEKL